MREMCDTITGQSQGKSRLHDVITTMNIHMHILLLLPVLLTGTRGLVGNAGNYLSRRRKTNCSQAFQVIISKA